VHPQHHLTDIGGDGSLGEQRPDDHHAERHHIGGYIGIITALAAWYTSAAGVSNGIAGNRIKLPVGPPLLAPSPVPSAVIA
jgi:hypothetical protein